MVGGGIGTIVIALLAYFLGIDPGVVTDQIPPQVDPRAQSGQPRSPEEDSLSQFVSVVLAETEDVWNEVLRKEGTQYREPTLVMFSQQVQSACGIAGASVGPFYCPQDAKVYIDLAFYRELRSRFGAPGDFAQAYVIAHEVGHHVQNLLGISDKVQQMQARASREEANRLSVRLELQADFLAGVWAHYAQQRGILDPGDLEEALNAASAIGDDRLQEEAQGRVVPDSFTHGTSEQRMRWFKRGLETGDINQGDTFGTENL
jgi:predicted metalloprotease